MVNRPGDGRYRARAAEEGGPKEKLRKLRNYLRRASLPGIFLLPFLVCLESNPSGRTLGEDHALADGLKDDLELFIILLLQLLNLVRQVPVGSEHLPQTNKSPHDSDVDLHGSGASQNTGEHRHPLLGERAGRVTAASIRPVTAQPGRNRCLPHVSRVRLENGNPAMEGQCQMREQQRNDQLHGLTLELILNSLVDHLGWIDLGKRINIRCFNRDPSVQSSLKFLRKTPWAKKKVENLYIATQKNSRRR